MRGGEHAANQGAGFTPDLTIQDWLLCKCTAFIREESRRRYEAFLPCGRSARWKKRADEKMEEREFLAVQDGVVQR